MRSSARPPLWTSKFSQAMRELPPNTKAAKEVADTYLASNVTGVLPEWAAAAGADPTSSTRRGFRLQDPRGRQLSRFRA